ncbi:MAG: hypothetical protein WAV54_16640 [Acidimicrobiales bacterium]
MTQDDGPGSLVVERLVPAVPQRPEEVEEGRDRDDRQQAGGERTDRRLDGTDRSAPFDGVDGLEPHPRHA